MTVIELESCILKKVSDDVIEVILSGEINLANTKIIIEERMKLSDGKKMNLVVYVDDIIKVDKTALVYLVIYGNKLVSKIAVIMVNSMIASKVMNDFFSIPGFGVPVNIFKDYDDAMDWLNS